MRVFLIGTAAFFSVTPLQAQVFDPIPYSYTNSSISWQNHDRLADHIYNKSEKDEVKANAPDPSIKPLKKPLAPSNLTFVASPEHTKGNLDRLAAIYSIAYPDVADAFTNIFTPNAVSGAQKFVEKMGLRKNNIADILAVYLVITWSSSQIVKGEIRPEQYQAVAAQTSKSLLLSPALVSMTNQEKQYFAEQTLMITLINSYVSVRMAETSGDPMIGRQISIASARTMGFEMERLSLTSRGFEAIR